MTTVATENDGDRAVNDDPFSVTLLAGTDTGFVPPSPLEPVLDIGANDGVEDSWITLEVNATGDPSDPTNPSVSVVISDLPSGAGIQGATLNPLTGDYIASATAVANGDVEILPPEDFSGTMDVTIEAIAVTTYGYTHSTGEVTVSMFVDPVADPPSIGASPNGGNEDETIDLSITVSLKDNDGSEVTGDFVYVELTDGATLLPTYDTVDIGDPDADLDGTSVVGFYRIPKADLGSLPIQPRQHWHGTFDVNIVASTLEQFDDLDGDHFAVNQR